mgnify:CR=1 FL=1
MKRGAVILTGGRSTRMGRDKAWLPFDGERLLARVARTLLECVRDVVVVARPGQELPPLPATVRVVRDDVPDQGPVGGLVPGLRASRAQHVFATSCDVPFLQPALVERLFDLAEGTDVAVAETGGFTHPLCAVYARRVLPELERLLAAGRLRPVHLYDGVETVRVNEGPLRQVDPGLVSLVNVNTPEAYDEALRGHLPEVRVELFDLARARAGAAVVSVHASTVGGALLALADRCPSLVPDVLDADGCPGPHWRVSLDAERFVADRDTPVDARSRVLLLSALAGG